MPSGIDTLQRMTESRLKTAPSEKHKEIAVTDFVLRARALFMRNPQGMPDENRALAFEDIRTRLGRICRVHAVDDSRAQNLLPPVRKGDSPAFGPKEPSTGIRKKLAVIGYPGPFPAHEELERLQNLLAEDVRGKKSRAGEILTAVRRIHQKCPGFLQYAGGCSLIQLRSLVTCLKVRFPEVQEMIEEKDEEEEAG